MKYLYLIKNKFPFSSFPSFTLVELLIVIGILAILTSAIVLILNPAELLRQSRDTTRSNDLASVHSALSLLLTQNPSQSLGTTNTIYVSLPDTSSLCINLGLPTLPSGYTYNCVPAASSSNIDGTGWLPINFASSSIGSLPKLPTDPTNTTSSGLYYTYTTNGTQYELTTQTESTKGSTPAITDGGTLPGVYELGTNLTLTPETRDRGLVGYWSFDEGSGTTAYDRSGYGNNGTLVSSPTWQSGSNCKRGGCLRFIDTDNCVSVPNSSSLNISGKYVSASLWVYMNSYLASSTAPTLLVKENNNPPWGGYMLRFSGAYPQFFIGAGSDGGKTAVSSSALPVGKWSFIVGVFDGVSVKIYVDGVLLSQTPYSGSIYTNPNALFIPQNGYIPTRVNGSIDDVRVYNRALSATEIKSLYDATK